jgi:hypothetical protein
MSAKTPTSPGKTDESRSTAPNSTKPLEFSPVQVGNFEYTVEYRIQELEALLGQTHWEHLYPYTVQAMELYKTLQDLYDFQRPNIRKMIELYKTGQLTIPCSKKIWLANGEVIDGPPKEFVKGVCYIQEVLIPILINDIVLYAKMTFRA